MLHHWRYEDEQIRITLTRLRLENIRISLPSFTPCAVLRKSSASLVRASKSWTLLRFIPFEIQLCWRNRLKPEKITQTSWTAWTTLHNQQRPKKNKTPTCLQDMSLASHRCRFGSSPRFVATDAWNLRDVWEGPWLKGIYHDIMIYYIIDWEEIWLMVITIYLLHLADV